MFNPSTQIQRKTWRRTIVFISPPLSHHADVDADDDDGGDDNDLDAEGGVRPHQFMMGKELQGGQCIVQFAVYLSQKSCIIHL